MLRDDQSHEAYLRWLHVVCTQRAEQQKQTRKKKHVGATFKIGSTKHNNEKHVWPPEGLDGQVGFDAYLLTLDP